MKIPEWDMALAVDGYLEVREVYSVAEGLSLPGNWWEGIQICLVILYFFNGVFVL